MPALSFSQFDHYAYALLAVVGTLGAVLTIMWFMTRSPWQAQIRALHGVAPPFINVLGVLFGLTLAFIANDTWSAHDKATTAVYQEADAIRSVAVLSTQLDAPLRQRLQEALRAYAQASADEWASLARRSASAEADQRANALLRACVDRQVEAALGGNVHALLLAKVADIRHDRDQRISLSQMHLNPLKWVGMALLGLLTLMSIAVVHVENPRAACVSITLFALSAAPTAAIVLIQGNPFMPPSFVSPAPILAAALH